jgi:hypothetical protein
MSGILEMIVSFEYHPWLDQLLAGPAIMVAWAAFGVPAVMFMFALPVFILRKIGLPLPDGFVRFFYTSSCLVWLTGFIVMMILLFSGISGLRMLLIWCLMYFFYAVFCFLYHRPLQKWLNSISAEKEIIDAPKPAHRKRSAAGSVEK